LNAPLRIKGSRHWQPPCIKHCGLLPLITLQVDQGLGIGTKSPLFNRMTVQLSRFLQVR
jgi:hypothetical protein